MCGVCQFKDGVERVGLCQLSNLIIECLSEAKSNVHSYNISRLDEFANCMLL